MKYETNRTWLLIFGAMLIGYSQLGIFFDGGIPFTSIKLKNPGNIGLVLFCIASYFIIYTAYTWYRLPKQERSLFDLIFCLAIGFIAVIPAVLRALATVGLTWGNVLLGFVLLTVGVLYGISLWFVLIIPFSIRSKHEMKTLGLGRIPVASKLISRTLVFLLLPCDVLFAICIVFTRQRLPEPLDQYWWIFLLGPFLLLNANNIVNTLLCLGPAPVRQAAVKRLRILSEPLAIHEMQYQFIGLEPTKKYEVSRMCLCAATGATEEIKTLLDKGGDPNEQDGRGWSPLMWASAEGHATAANLLLAHGANPNAENYLGRTALMYASRYGYISIVRNLLDSGAEINPAEDLGENPPLLAAAQHGHQEVVSLLLEKGADILHANHEGKTALELAMEAGHGEIAKIIRISMAEKSRDGNPDLPRALGWIEGKLDGMNSRDITSGNDRRT